MDTFRKRFVFKSGNSNRKIQDFTRQSAKIDPVLQRGAMHNSNAFSNADKFDRPISSKQTPYATNIITDSRRDIELSRRDLESPAKKCKLSTQLEDDVDPNFNFDDFEDDDFSKGLTADDLSLLEIEASQMADMIPAKVSEERGGSSKLSALHQFDKFLTEKTTSVSNCQEEKTLDLFSNYKTEISLSNSGYKKDKSHLDKLQYLENQLAEYTRKVKLMEESSFAKDGEIKILRNSLNKAHDECDEVKSKLNQIEGKYLQNQGENQQKLQREIEKLTTQLQFKDKEIQEIKEWKLKNEKICNEVRSPKGFSGTKKPFGPIKTLPKSNSKSSLLLQNNAFDIQKSSCSTESSWNSGSSFDKEQSSLPIYNRSGENSTNISLMSGLPVKREISYVDLWLIQKAMLDDFMKTIVHSDFHNADQEGSLENENDDDHSCSLPSIDLFFQCSQSLQMQKDNLFSIIELILPHILETLQAKAALNVLELDLTCNEEMDNPLPQNTEHCHKIITSDHDNKSISYELRKTSLVVLNAVVKHSCMIQGYLLYGLLDGDSKDIDKTSLDYPTDSNLCALFEESSMHILIQKSDSLSIPKINMESQLHKDIKTFKPSSKELMETLFSLLKNETCGEDTNMLIWDLFANLASSKSSVSKSGLLKMLKQYHCLHCLVKKFHKDYILIALSLMKSLATFPGIADLLCQKEGECSLQFIYKLLIQTPANCTKEELSYLRLEVIHTISTLVASQNGMMKLILESGCDCNCDIVKSLVMMLLSDLKELRTEHLQEIENNTLEDSAKFVLFRQGMLLLTHIGLNDRIFMDHRIDVDWQYINLIYGTINFFRRIPCINESEVLALQDLLDMEQYEDAEEIEDGPNEALPMETE